MKRAIIIAKGKVQKVGYRDFVQDKIKYGDVPEELGDRLGAALLYLGATNQKIDAGFKMVGEKQDMMLGKQNMMLQKQDDTIEAIDRSKDEIVTEIRSLREDLSLEKKALPKKHCFLLAQVFFCKKKKCYGEQVC